MTAHEMALLTMFGITVLILLIIWFNIISEGTRYFIVSILSLICFLKFLHWLLVWIYVCKGYPC